MIVNRRWVAVVWSLVASSCATTSPLLRQQCYNADVQLAAVLRPLEALRARGCEVAVAEKRFSECDALRQDLDRLVVVCPAHVPTLMANAVYSYEEQQPIRSQQMLDQILAQPRSYPDAAVLRARIAVEEGNVPFARRLLEQHIRLVPDHAGLHELHGAILYLAGLLPDATRALTTAEALGAPRWRVAYHLGLIEEALGRFDEASRLYAEATAGHPGWAPAMSRFNALRSAAGTRP
jgi:tetratricopeptide (TPR) repeat protein